jgi:hypothetical protein
MIYILIFLTYLLIFVVFYLLVRNRKLKAQHNTTVQKLQGIISALNHEQKSLNDKVSVSAEYDSVSIQNQKLMLEELLELNKVLLGIITK